jgi:hypothetical protein
MAPKAAADPEQHALANQHEKRWEDSHQEVRSDGRGRYENQVHVSPLGVSVSAEKRGDISEQAPPQSRSGGSACRVTRV